MKNNKFLFLKSFLLGMVITWVILTAGVFAKAGFRPEMFTGKNLPLVIGIYLLVGVICGGCFGTFIYMIKKK